MSFARYNYVIRAGCSVSNYYCKHFNHSWLLALSVDQVNEFSFGLPMTIIDYGNDIILPAFPVYLALHR